LNNNKELNDQPNNHIQNQKFDHRIDHSKVRKAKYENGEDIRIGSGATGIVYLGLYGERQVAIKEFDVTDDPDLKKIALEEAIIQTQIKHPNIINYYGFFERKQSYLDLVSSESVTLISDLYSRGTLFTSLHNSKVPVLYQTRLKWALQIASAFEYLSSMNITHRDLKPENILISDKNDAVVADFGFAKRLNTILTKKKFHTQIGSILWMAPEIFQGLDYSYPVDVYAYGILLFELLFKKRPYLQQDFNNEELFKQRIIGIKSIINGNEVIQILRPNLEGINSTDLDFDSSKFSQYASLMKRCWDPDPKKRPEWKEIIFILYN
jgi:serine/threonine protein kinase